MSAEVGESFPRLPEVLDREPTVGLLAGPGAEHPHWAGEILAPAF